MSGSKRIVIIGGVACGPKAAARARRCDPRADITLVEQGDTLSYAGCGLPYVVGGTIPDVDSLQKTTFDVLRNEDYFQSVKNIQTYTQTVAESINRSLKTVTVRDRTHDRRKEIPYDTLVLATGSKPFLPPIPGIDVKGVFVLHRPSDAKKIRRRIDEGEVDRAVIIGAGLIGLEMVESLFNHAVDAIVLEKESHIMPSFLDADMADYVTHQLIRDGVEIHTNQKVKAIKNANNRVSAVVTEEQEFPADMVIIAAGVKPNVSLAQSAGLQLGTTGAIAVNPFLQTSDPHIYAGGDCVECTDIVSGSQIYSPLGSTANKHGRVIGNNITGHQESFPGILGTMIMKVLNIHVARTGLTEMKAKSMGFDVTTSLTPCLDHVHFYPGNKHFILKLITNHHNGHLLGAQIAGTGDVAKRIDVLATAIQMKADLHTVANLDLSYSPPFSHALDGVIQASNHTRNKIDNNVSAISYLLLNEKINAEKNVIVLDVREEKETLKKPFSLGQTLCIPLTQLRNRMDEIPPSCEIVCCCAQGVRSYEACFILQNAGFKNLSYLEGGLKMVFQNE